ncbi:hypothetical protein K438DRAFT_914703 [Mycena galopus ATCC 62051]|nr:hypothetical protein K438DRAFT_914703 [Mycena galopus ATCC 62051]
MPKPKPPPTSMPNFPRPPATPRSRAWDEHRDDAVKTAIMGLTKIAMDRIFVFFYADLWKPPLPALFYPPSQSHAVHVSSHAKSQCDTGPTTTMREKFRHSNLLLRLNPARRWLSFPPRIKPTSRLEDSVLQGSCIIHFAYVTLPLLSPRYSCTGSWPIAPVSHLRPCFQNRLRLDVFASNHVALPHCLHGADREPQIHHTTSVALPLSTRSVDRLETYS